MRKREGEGRGKTKQKKKKKSDGTRHYREEGTRGRERERKTVVLDDNDDLPGCIDS